MPNEIIQTLSIANNQETLYNFFESESGINED